MWLIFCLVSLWFANASQSSERPVLQEILVPRKLVENQKIRLNCDLIQGAKPIRFSWFFNDEPIRESERLEIDTSRDYVSSLMIKGLSVDSVGRYKCVGANDHGSDQQTVAVYVNSKSGILIFCFKLKLNDLLFPLAKPVITSDLQNITGLLNQPVRLDCQAKGFPQVETKWSRVVENGNAKETVNFEDFVLKLLFFVEIQEHQTKRLEFNLTRESAGQYICSAWNSNGRVEKSIRVDYYGEFSLR